MELQVELEKATRVVWDAVIVGAGPAGTVAAERLSARGHSVLILERWKFPRDKTCGDGLITDSLEVLARLGILDEVRAFGYTCRRLRVYSPRRISFAVSGEFLTVKRTLFDRRLVEHAVSRGACLCIGEATNVFSQADGATVEVRGASAPVRARVVLLATGAKVTLLKKCGILARSRASGVAVRRYVRSSERIDEWLVSFDRSVCPGYGWIFPVGPGEYNIGCGLFYDEALSNTRNVRQLYDEFMDSFPPAIALHTARTSEGPLEGALLRCGLDGSRFTDGNRVLVIGEALGSTLHLTGEGIGKAMQTAELAADVAHDALAVDDYSRLEEFSSRTSSELAATYEGFRKAQQWLSRPWVADLSALRIASSPTLRARIEGVLNEKVSPVDLFSLRALVT